MARVLRKRTMHGMSTPLVIENPMDLEPVTADTFISDLDVTSTAGAARRAAFIEQLASAPRRRIYD
jgi:hypothetical protein